jgi:hypothetical protein
MATKPRPSHKHNYVHLKLRMAIARRHRLQVLPKRRRRLELLLLPPITLRLMKSRMTSIFRHRQRPYTGARKSSKPQLMPGR